MPIPPGYLLTGNGVAIDNDDAEALAFRPCWVSAVSRDTKGANWSRLVHWIDLDGHEHSEAIPAELFHAQGNELTQRLASNGLPIAPGREKKLIRYLTAFQPEARMISAIATGWHREAFILPQHTIHQPEGERIVLQVVGGASDEAIGAAGRFGAWRDLVAGVPEIVRFLICASLAAPLRYLLNVEAGGSTCAGPPARARAPLCKRLRVYGVTVWSPA